MSPFYTLALLCLVAQSSLSVLAAPVLPRGSVNLFPAIKVVSSQAVNPSSTASASSSTATATTFCSKWAATCSTTCASIDATAVASSSCRVSGQVLRRAQLGALSCKCGSQTITQKIVAQVYKPVNAASTTTASSSSTASSTAAASTRVALASTTSTTGATLPVVTRVTADNAAIWRGNNFIPVDDAIPDASAASAASSSATSSPVYIGTWTPAGASATVVHKA